jgi:hypothetical protein
MEQLVVFNPVSRSSFGDQSNKFFAFDITGHLRQGFYARWHLFLHYQKREEPKRGCESKRLGQEIFEISDLYFSWYCLELFYIRSLP